MSSAPEEPIVEEMEPMEVSDSSDESQESGESSEASRGSRLSFLKTLTIYDAILVASALSIALACLLLFLEVTSFGGLFFQWRTGEALAEPLTPP